VHHACDAQPHCAQHATHIRSLSASGAEYAGCNTQPALSQQLRCGNKHRNCVNATCIAQHPACSTQRANMHRTTCTMQRVTSQWSMDHPTGRDNGCHTTYKIHYDAKWPHARQHDTYVHRAQL
jgi:hypothetical protein